METTTKEFYFQSNYPKTMIHVIQWAPEKPVKGILQISHGMVEYIERYEDFARYLNRYGFLVVGNDHLGHGESVNAPEERGHFWEKNGSDILVADMHQLRTMMQEQYPGIPYFMLGHSMGSFLLRKYLTIHGKGLAGAILMGTGYQPTVALKVGKFLASVGAFFRGWDSPGKKIDRIVFQDGAENRKQGQNGETDYSNSWLSKETELVRKYKEDERSQFVFTLNGYYCLFDTIEYLNHRRNLKGMDPDVPILLVSGSEDKVGANGRGVRYVYYTLKKLPVHDVRMKIFEGDRHEILNETDRDRVYDTIRAWLLRKLEATEEKQDIRR